VLLRWYRLVLTVPAVVLGALGIRACLLIDRVLGRRQPLDGLGRWAQVAWCRLFCRLYGIRVSTAGAPLAAAPALIASNHVSWLDIVVIASQWPVAFLSKSEVARWPLVGGVATGLGTLYIQRGARQAAVRTQEAMVARLHRGQRILFFPEGTTSDGSGVLPFRPRLYQSAIDAGAVVQPLALSYRDADGRHRPEVPFVGDQSMLANIHALASVPRLVARLELAEPLAVRAGTRSQLSAASRTAIRSRLGLSVDDDKESAATATASASR